MPRRWVLVLALGVSLSLLPAPVFGQDYTLDRPSTGQVVYLEPGELVEITLTSSPSTGYSWTKAVEDNAAVLAQENHWLEEKTVDLVGAPGTEHWVFRAVGPGKSRIDLGYSRPWESRPPEQRVTIEVNVAKEEVAGYPGSIWVDSQEVRFSERPILKGGRVMVELDQLASALGSTVTALGTVVKITRGERSVTIDHGKGAIQIGSTSRQLPVYRSGGKVMVPIRVIAEGLGCQIQWRAEDQAILIGR
ncbi:MAG: hypothetical protein HPY50_14600 [Firmicutes bacterium]|nr:hypothetical protein [Bacillota bacterium]